jgi:hypothetical protein
MKEHEPCLPPDLAPFASTLGPAEFARTATATHDSVVPASAGSIAGERRLPRS